MSASKRFGALSDIKVLDLTQMLAGPYATMMLADHGAQVVKVESPGGDMTRSGGPFLPDDEQKSHGAYFQSVNRNKKSIVLDLKSGEGRDAFLALIEDVDVVVENFRSGVMERLGLAYETLSEKNPRLVYGALRGFGDRRTGASPYADWPAFDVVAQAMGGIMGITGPDADHPTKIGPGVGDIVPGIMLSFGILAAVHHARVSGKGQFVDISMLDSMLAVCERAVYQYSVDGEIAGPQGNGHPFMCPFGMFEAKDGFVTIAAPDQNVFAKLCELILVPELAEDNRFNCRKGRHENRKELEKLLNRQTRIFTKAELKEKLGGIIPFGPVMQMDEIAVDPHFVARSMVVPVEQPGSLEPIHIAGSPVKMTETPGGVHRRAPYLGEDTEAILREAGLDDDAIERLVDKLPSLAEA